MWGWAILTSPKISAPCLFILQRYDNFTTHAFYVSGLHEFPASFDYFIEVDCIFSSEKGHLGLACLVVPFFKIGLSEWKKIFPSSKVIVFSGLTENIDKKNVE
jgi:hypothetical protein